MGKIEELEQMAATIKNETATGANTAERVGLAFEKAAEAIKQGAENATITLDSLNEFPSTTQEAINYVKNNGKNTQLSVIDRTFSVGVVRIFADAATQVLTEVFETRLTLQNDKFVKGHTYGAPVKYWRNYGLKQDYAQEKIKRGEWTKWAKCEDDTALSLYAHSKFLCEVYNGSQNGEPKSLAEVVAAVNSEYTNEFKRCYLVSFVDRATNERVLYHCSSPNMVSSISAWKLVGSSEHVVSGQDTPAILPFEDFVENVSPTAYSAASGEIVFDTRNNVFLCKTGSDYCPTWAGMEEYGAPTNEGVTPKEKVIYFHATKHEIYTWYEGVFQKLGSVPAGGGVDSRIRLVNHDTNDTTFVLTPNTMHVWGVVKNLTLSLAPNTNPNILAEYCFQFISPTNRATMFSISGVKWAGGEVPAIKAGKLYQGRIVNGVAVILEA